MGSLALRPGDSLAIHMMALSIGSRIFSFLPSCYSRYWALTLTQVGLTSHCSCQPSLDAHFPFLIRNEQITSRSVYFTMLRCVSKHSQLFLSSVRPSMAA